MYETMEVMIVKVWFQLVVEVVGLLVLIPARDSVFDSSSRFHYPSSDSSSLSLIVMVRFQLVVEEGTRQVC